MPTRSLRDDGKVVQTFTATETWTVPSGVQSVEVECWGGGGGGGAGQAVTNGGGGGGGAYSRKVITVVPGTSMTATVGAGGAGAGGDSWFGSAATVMAEGGTRGVDGDALNNGAGGPGGTAAASVGDTKFSGGNGGANTGGGGGGAGDAANGGNSVGTTGGAGGTAGGGNGGNGGSASPGLPGNVRGGAGGGGGIISAGGAGARGEIRVVFTEVGVNTTVAVPGQRESFVDPPGSVTTVAAHAQSPAIADTAMLTALALHAGADALAEALTAITAAAHSSAEALASIQDVSTVTVLAQRESIAEPPATVATIAAFAFADGLAQADTVVSLAAHAALDALADVQVAATIALIASNWRRVSPGLSGTAYDATGTVAQDGAQVLVFRDDTNALIATLTTDALGKWATDLDPAFQYWVSYWSAEGAGATDNIFGRTDRGLVPVETTVEMGT